VILDDTDFTEDAILRGLVRVVQPRRGYRFSLDALLLADFAARLPGQRIVDLGCGSGVVGFVLAARRPTARVIGVEIQPALCEAARRGVRLNGLADRVAVVEGDLRRADELWPAGSFDLAVCNPPYFAPRRGRPSPDAGRAVARHSLTCEIADVLRAARHALRPHGRLALVQPAAEVAGEGLCPRTIRPVVSRAGRPARRHLIELGEARPGGPHLLAPLVVHEGDGYSAELRALLGDG
jgi:tRNA1Val (adenine37-N6)-methyltransferase